MALFLSSNNAQEEPIRGTSWDGGAGGSGNDERYIIIWQTSPEESTKDGQNCKKRCV
jgi:hypothetical protein